MALIACVRVDPPRSWEDAVHRLDSLPEPGRYLATVVRCDDAVALEELIHWFSEQRRLTPTAVGVVLAVDFPLLRALAQSPLQPRPLITADELPLQRMRAEHMGELIEQGIWFWTREALGRVYGLRPTEPLLGPLVTHGLAGRGVGSLANASGHSRTMLYEEFDRLALPGPGEMLRIVRHAGVLIGTKLGARLPVAIRRAGWMSPASYRGARYRIALAMAAVVTVASPAPADAATCKDSYLVCLNNNVYDETGDDDELESIECGARYAACLMRIF